MNFFSMYTKVSEYQEQQTALSAAREKRSAAPAVGEKEQEYSEETPVKRSKPKTKKETLPEGNDALNVEEAPETNEEEE